VPVANPTFPVSNLRSTSSSERQWLVGLLLLAIVVRLATLGTYPLMDNTEARYAELARKMVETGDWLMPQVRYGAPWWSKPPLSIWLTSLSFVAFGVNEFAARLPEWLLALGIMGLTMVAAATRAMGNLALRSAVVLFTSVLFFGTAGGVMTDATLVLGTTMSMVAFWMALVREGPAARGWGYLFFIGLAIGLLAKGPVGVVLTLAPCGLWTLWKWRIGDVWRRLPWITGTLLCAAIAVPWYLAAEARTPGFLEYFIVGEHWKRYTVPGWSGDKFGTAHVRPRGTIWPLGLAATLPWCIVWLGLLWRMRRAGTPLRTPDADGWRAYLWLWLLASPVFFTFAGNILITYVLPAMPAFALLVGQAWERVEGEGRIGWGTRIAALFVPVGIVIALLFVMPRVAPDFAHDRIVAQYLAQRSGDTQRLIYLEEAPQSAQFYARGKVTVVDSGADIEKLVSEERGDFFVLKQPQLDAIPALKDRFKVIGASGKFLLLRATAAPAAAK
jgi:4-amino-4-deoxy-L-arabinose transferase-like glycosyltransferase